MARELNFLVTGGTGNLGHALLHDLLGRGCNVSALIRPASRGLLLWQLARRGCSPTALRLVEGDLLRPRCGTAADLSGVTDIVHCAADVRWHAPAQALFDTNVAGTRHLLDLAETLPRLNSITVVSSAFVCGTREGSIAEEYGEPSGFNNPYEASKYLMERLVRSRGLPVRIVRPSIIAGDEEDGTIQNFTALYAPLKLIAQGRHRLFTGFRDCRLDIVPASYAARVLAMLHLNNTPPGPAPIHLCAGAAAPTLLQIWEAARDFMVRSRGDAVADPFLLPPAFVKMAAVGKSRSLARLNLYLPYLTQRRTFRTGALDALNTRTPPYGAFFDTIFSYALTQGFHAARYRYAAACAP